MSNYNSHIGIPETLLREFSRGEPLFVYDLNNNKIYQTTPKKAGRIKKYYSEEVEKLLSDKLETLLGVFLSDINKLDKNYDVTNYLNKNHEVLGEFIKLQFQRSKKNLDAFNKTL